MPRRSQPPPGRGAAIYAARDLEINAHPVKSGTLVAYQKGATYEPVLEGLEVGQVLARITRGLFTTTTPQGPEERPAPEPDAPGPPKEDPTPADAAVGPA